MTEIKVLADPIAFVRKDPGRFFRLGKPDPIEVVSHITSEALLLGARGVETARHGPWWSISSATDWLARVGGHQVFTRVLALPQGGPNSMYAEILLIAFAEVVVTSGTDGYYVMKGSLQEHADVEATPRVWRQGDIPKRKVRGRAILFRWGNVEKAR